MAKFVKLSNQTSAPLGATPGVSSAVTNGLQRAQPPDHTFNLSSTRISTAQDTDFFSTDIDVLRCKCAIS